MQSGKHVLTRPFISEKIVRAALNGLLYARVSHASENPLHALLLVDEFLADPSLPPSAHSREFAVQHILTSLITDQLRHSRRVLGYSWPTDDSLSNALKAIEADRQYQSPEIIGWSILYYRYVRVDLNLTSEILCTLLHIDQRTLRRYMSHAVRRLTDHLTSAEWQARIRQHKRKLYTALPISTPLQLFGRDKQLALAQRLLDMPPPHHLQITGPSGIGKSAFTNELIRRQIDTEKLDFLIWINRPSSVQQVIQQVYEYLIPEGAAINCREYLLLFRGAVVLEDMQILVEDHSELEKLLDFLSPALVCLISPHYIPLGSQITHIPLRELNRDEALDLIGTISEQQLEGQLSQDEMAAIWHNSGGNPMALKLATHNLILGLPDLGLPGIVDRLYSQTYLTLDPRLRRAWLVCALLPPGPIDLHGILNIWPDYINAHDLEILIQRGLIEVISRDPWQAILPASARHYWQYQNPNDPETASFFAELTNCIENQLHTGSLPLLNLVEHLLMAKWPDIDYDRRHRWVNLLWGYGLRQGHFARWCIILEYHTSHDIALQIPYAACLRRLGEWATARMVLEKVTADSGAKGDFYLQAKALLELAILHRYQGSYETALHLLRRAEHIILRYSDDELRQTLRLEQAQLAVDYQNGVQALQYLSDVSEESGRCLALQSEALALQGEYEQSRTVANRAIPFLKADAAALGALYTVLGRGCEKQGDLDNAHRYLASALTQIEHSGYGFALARARSNLGALLIQTEAYDEAYELLKQAEHIQTQLGDQAALMITHHNLNIVAGHLTD